MLLVLIYFIYLLTLRETFYFRICYYVTWPEYSLYIFTDYAQYDYNYLGKILKLDMANQPAKTNRRLRQRSENSVIILKQITVE